MRAHGHEFKHIHGLANLPFFTTPSAPCSFGLSATSQQYFSLTTNQPSTTNQQYFSLRTNQHKPSATSQTNMRIHGTTELQPGHHTLHGRRRRQESFLFSYKKS
jgi:hypothetical protein